MEDVHSLLTDVPPPSGEQKKFTFEMRLFKNINILVHNYYSTNYLKGFINVSCFAIPRLKTHSLKIFTLELR